MVIIEGRPGTVRSWPTLDYHHLGCIWWCAGIFPDLFSCMSLLLAFTSLSTSTMASVANCPLPAALAALSDTPCLQSVPTTSLRTSSSSGNGAEHEHDDQQEQRQYAHRHHPGSDNGDTAINERTPQHITVCHWRRYYCTQCTMRMRNRYSTVGTSKCPLQINY